MGALHLFNLHRFIEQYQCDMFIETGTNKGWGVSYATKFPFSQIFSIEFNKDLFLEISETFDKVPHIKNVKLLNGVSYEVLDNLLPTLKSKSILFLLDAHYMPNWEKIKEIDAVLPLEREVEVILKHRKEHKDVIIIDDYRNYKDINCQNGPIELDYPNLITKKDNFIDSLLSSAYNIFEIGLDTGYLVCCPKNKKI